MPHKSRKLLAASLVLAAVFFFSGPTLIFAEASPDSLKKIESALVRIEKKQQELADSQKKILAELDNIKVRVRRA